MSRADRCRRGTVIYPVISAARAENSRTELLVELVAAAVVLRRDGALLLQHRDDKPGLRAAGLWGLPGGHAELGESMIECARRELREETDFDASDLRFLLSSDETDRDGTEFRVTYYWCWYDELQPLACHEGQALAFVRRAEVENYPMPVYLLDVLDAAIAEAGLRISK